MKKLSSLMVKDVVTVSPFSTLTEVAEKMRKHEIGVLPVCEDGRVVGMITDRDIVIRSMAQGRDPDEVTTREVMSRNVVFCYEDQTIDDAASLMEEKKIGRLVVLDHDHNLRGIISLGNLTHELGRDRLAAFIEEKLQRRRFAPMAGALAGAAGLAAGAYWFSRRSA